MANRKNKKALTIKTTADKKTQTCATVTVRKISDSDVAAAMEACTIGMEDVDAFMAKHFAGRPDEAPPINEHLQKWADIITLLRDKEMDFSWSEETHTVVAKSSVYWDRLKAVRGRSHLYAYRTLPFPEFMRINRSSKVSLVPKADNPNLLYMTYKIKNRLAMREKGVKILSLEHWDGKDDPWARRHFFDVVEMASRIYFMMKNTIEMGWLTWDKNKMMLAGPPVMWNMARQIKVWKGIPFPDFYSWQYILDTPIDVSKIIPNDILAPNAYRNYYHEVNGTDDDRRFQKSMPAPVIFGIGTTNKIAKKIYQAIKQYRWETYQIYTNLTHPQMEYDQHSMMLIGTDLAWTAISNPMTVDDLGFDGSVWKHKQCPLFFKGFFAFENIVATNAEKMREKVVAAQANRLLTETPTGANKAMIKELQQLQKEADFAQRKLKYGEKKIATHQKLRKADPTAEAGGQLHGCQGCHSQSINSESCRDEACITCTVACTLCGHGFIRMKEIYERESVNYAGFPTTRLEIDLLFEPTKPHILKTIVNDFKLLENFDRLFYKPLAEHDFEEAHAWHAEYCGPKLRRPGPRGVGLIERESPFRLGSAHYEGDDDIGQGIWLDGMDAVEVFEKGFVPSLRKMVCLAGKKGRQEMMDYVTALNIKWVPKEQVPKYLDFINALGEKGLEVEEQDMYDLNINQYGFKSADDLGYGLILIENLFTDECIPLLRKFVIDAGIAWRHITERRLRKEGIETLDRLTLGNNDMPTLLDILQKPQLTIEHAVVKQMKACGVFDSTVQSLKTDINTDASIAHLRRQGKLNDADLDIKTALDIGHGVRLANTYLVREGKNKIDTILRDECRALMLRHGKENRAIAMKILEERGIKLEDMTDPRRAEAEAKGNKIWAREPVKPSKMDLLDRIMRKKIEMEEEEEEEEESEEAREEREKGRGVPEWMLWEKGPKKAHDGDEHFEDKENESPWESEEYDDYDEVKTDYGTPPY